MHRSFHVPSFHVPWKRIAAALFVAVFIAAVPMHAQAQSGEGQALREVDENVAVMEAPSCCLYSWGTTWMLLIWVSGGDVSSDRAEVRYIREDATDMSDEQWTVETADTDYYHWVEGLERNVRYVFQVRSGNEQGFGPWSESLTDRTRTRPEPIHNPTVTRGDGSLKVRWPQFADADDIDYIGYYVYWIDATAHSQFLISRWNRSDLIASVDPCSDDDSYDNLEHVIAGLSNNVRYKVVVRAQTSWGDISTPFHLNQASSATPGSSGGTLTATVPTPCPPETSEGVVTRSDVLLGPSSTLKSDALVEAVGPPPAGDPPPADDGGEDDGDGNDAEEDAGDGNDATVLTAEFVESTVPQSHDGTRKFTVRVQFSESIAVSYRTLRDDLLEVTNGRALKFKRVDGRSDLWEIRVKPSGTDDVTLLLPAATACATSSDGQARSQTQVCTAAGAPLSHDLEVEVPYQAPAASE
ncbi:hypothetical protein [Candidatus Poriferisodalis sp.]|uniref:hypothetical protein n=1 Tax=Candidatus Poriferisodalis sp. TaxID=3101277 RepID=UPI003B52F325